MQEKSTVEEQWIHLFSSFEGQSHELIPVLQNVQETFGYLSGESLSRAATFLNIPKSRVYAVATFYAQFRFKPIGKKHIMVCRGTACHVNGATRVLEDLKGHLKIEEGETTESLEYSLESVACIGACSLAPCIMVNDDVEVNLTPKKIEELFKKGVKKEK